MVEIDMPICDIINEYGSITLVGRHGEKVKIELDKRERELLRERLEEKI